MYSLEAALAPYDKPPPPPPWDWDCAWSSVKPEETPQISMVSMAKVFAPARKVLASPEPGLRPIPYENSSSEELDVKSPMMTRSLSPNCREGWSSAVGAAPGVG